MKICNRFLILFIFRYVDLCSSDDEHFVMELNREESVKIDLNHEKENEQTQSALNNGIYSTTLQPKNSGLTQDSGIGSWFPSQKLQAPPISPENHKPCKLKFDLSDDKSYEDDVETSMKRSETVRKYMDDMQPEDDKLYDYSYHPSDMIKFYYAGPSHWKLMERFQPEKKNKTISHKKLSKTVTLNDVMKIEEDSIKITEEDICMKRIQVKKSLLQLFFKIPNNIFDLYENASPDNRLRELTQEEEEINREFEECENSFIDSETKDYVTDFMDNNEQRPIVPSSKTERFGRHVCMSTASIINQQFSRKVDIKKVRKMSMLVVKNELNLAKTEVKFNDVCTKVNKLCENSCDTSCALIFYSLLQEAAEKKISLSQTETLNDFDIKPYQSDHCMTN